MVNGGGVFEELSDAKATQAVKTQDTKNMPDRTA
jgi:hypothetical protein